MDKLTAYNKMWRAMRIMKVFSVLDLQITTCDHTEEPFKAAFIRSYCKTLVNNNYLKKLKAADTFEVNHLIARGPLASFVNPAGEFIDPNKINFAPRFNYKTDQQRMWEMMSKLTSFSLSELIKEASENKQDLIKEWTAKHYCKILLHAGYLEMEKNDNLKLIKHTGAVAPFFNRERKIIDPNTKEIIEIYKTKKPKHKEAVLQSLVPGKKFTVTKLHNQTGIDKLALRTVIKRLLKEGRIEKAGEAEEQGNTIHIYILKNLLEGDK